MAGKYDTPLDRESAFEILRRRATEAAEEAARAEAEAEEANTREFNSGRRYEPAERSKSRKSRSDQESFGEAVTGVILKELKGTTGRRIVRGILGGLFRGR
jgi:hypothetical protein